MKMRMKTKKTAKMKKTKASSRRKLPVKKYPDNEFYEIRWYGCGHVLMSRNYVRDRESVQKYIDGVFVRLSQRPDGSRTVGRTPDFFVSLGPSQAGVDIRKVKEAKWPYNGLEDRFDQIHFLYCCPFVSMLDKEGLEEFAKQEKERQVEFMH